MSPQGKGRSEQAQQQAEFNLWDPHRSRRGLSPENPPPAAMRALAHTHKHIAHR